MAIDNALRTHFARLAWERRGYEKGYRDGSKECVDADMIMARKMIRDSFSLYNIRKYTDLPISRINEILKELHNELKNNNL